MRWLIVIVLLTLLISISLHIFFLFGCIRISVNKYLKPFISTAVSNALVTVTMIYIILKWPRSIYQIDFSIFLWLFSGVIMLGMLIIKIQVFRKIMRGDKEVTEVQEDPSGKKVYPSPDINQKDLALFMLSMPFFLFAGAYFIAKLISLCVHGTL